MRNTAKQADHTHSARVSGRTAVDATGRVRYRGRPRPGPTTTAQTDALDVALAIGELGRAHTLLLRCDDARLEKHERKVLHDEGLALATLAWRTVGSVVKRAPRAER